MRNRDCEKVNAQGSEEEEEEENRRAVIERSGDIG